jgi:hypothetical protein
MAGDEAGPEARARVVLAEMQERVIAGPHAALGIPPHATAADIRTAFLELTKVYHPARFGRMPHDVQRLATEVFLALRAAHDALAKPRQRGPILPSTTPARPTPMPPTSRTPGMPPAPSKPPTGQQPTLAGSKVPSGAHPTVGPPPGTPVAPQRPAAGSAPITMPRRTPTGSPPQKPSASASGAMRPPVEPELAPIYELMQRGQWVQARLAINALAAKAPDAVKYRALLSYTRGREAQLDRRLDEARVELHTALQLDPDLQIAKTALAELFTRRK